MLALLILCFVVPAFNVEIGTIDKIHLLKIRLPERPNRDETSDLDSINTIITSATGIDVMFLVKEVGNPIIFAVLKIQIECQWAQITNKLSARGDSFSSIPLFSCHDFAKDLNVTLPDNEIFISPFMYRVSHPVNGRTESKYIHDIAAVFRKIGELTLRSGGKIACFRDTIDIPLKMYLFTEDGSAIDLRQGVKLGAGVDYELELHKIQDLNTYVTTCST